jgi:hypothetical protein
VAGSRFVPPRSPPDKGPMLLLALNGEVSARKIFDEALQEHPLGCRRAVAFDRRGRLRSFRPSVAHSANWTRCDTQVRLIARLR